MRLLNQHLNEKKFSKTVKRVISCIYHRTEPIQNELNSCYYFSAGLVYDKN